MNINTRRLWQSLKRAFTLTSIVYFLLQIINVFAGDPITPFLIRLPLAWVWYWPKLFLRGSATITDRDLFVCLALNIAAYTVVIYAITCLRDNGKRTDD